MEINYDVPPPPNLMQKAAGQSTLTDGRTDFEVRTTRRKKQAPSSSFSQRVSLPPSGPSGSLRSRQIDDRRPPARPPAWLPAATG